MKIVVLSDIHANFAAVSSLREEYDELWVLGDLVDYGPNPCEVVDFVRSKASVVVRGNHDHAVAFEEDPRCSERFREMARQTQLLCDRLLSLKQKKYLGRLPLHSIVERDGRTVYLCHAVPSDPLFTYCPEDSDKWAGECARVHTDVLLVGHTHIPFMRRVGNCLVVNPGSAGQPKNGNPDMSYAVWDDGRIELRSQPYPVEKTVSEIRSLPLSGPAQRGLIDILRTGYAPSY
jgi:putative phosphoesterase